MADLICFPQSRNVGKARHVAATMDRRQPGRSRDAYWNTIQKQMVEKLRGLDFQQAEIDRQLSAFTDAVNRAVAEGWHFDQQQQPGGAA